MKVVGIIQARMGSSRLPGKILKEIAGQPMLKHIVQRLKRCTEIHELVIATSTHPQDDVVVEFARKNQFRWERGSEQDVLGRYYEVAKITKADVVLRLTGDCPLIDPKITGLVAREHLSSKKNDMTSNVLVRSYPRGLDTEALSFSCLERIHKEALDEIYREHVTNYIHDFQEKFTLANISSSQDLSAHRWCVDTPDDFELITRIYGDLYPQNPNFELQDILRLFERNASLFSINSHVPQAKIFKRKTIA